MEQTEQGVKINLMASRRGKRIARSLKLEGHITKTTQPEAFVRTNLLAEIESSTQGLTDSRQLMDEK